MSGDLVQEAARRFWADRALYVKRSPYGAKRARLRAVKDNTRAMLEREVRAARNPQRRRG